MKKGDLVKTTPNWADETWTCVVLRCVPRPRTRVVIAGFQPTSWVLVHCVEAYADNKHQQWIPDDLLEVINETR